MKSTVTQNLQAKKMSVSIISYAFINKFSGFSAIPNAYWPSDCALRAPSIYARTTSREHPLESNLEFSVAFFSSVVLPFCFWAPCVRRSRYPIRMRAERNFHFDYEKLLPMERKFIFLFHLQMQLNKRIENIQTSFFPCTKIIWTSFVHWKLENGLVFFFDECFVFHEKMKLIKLCEFRISTQCWRTWMSPF